MAKGLRPRSSNRRTRIFKGQTMEDSIKEMEFQDQKGHHSEHYELPRHSELEEPSWQLAVPYVGDEENVCKIHEVLVDGPPPHTRPKDTAGRGKIYADEYIDDGSDERSLSFNLLDHVISERNLPKISKVRPMNYDEYLIHCLVERDYNAFAFAVDKIPHPPDLTVLDAAVSCGDAFVVQTCLDHGADLMVITPSLAKDAARLSSNECMKQADVYSEHGALRLLVDTLRSSFPLFADSKARLEAEHKREEMAEMAEAKKLNDRLAKVEKKERNEAEVAEAVAKEETKEAVEAAEAAEAAKKSAVAAEKRAVKMAAVAEAMDEGGEKVKAEAEAMLALELAHRAAGEAVDAAEMAANELAEAKEAAVAALKERAEAAAAEKEREVHKKATSLTKITERRFSWGVIKLESDNYHPPSALERRIKSKNRGFKHTLRSLLPVKDMTDPELRRELVNIHGLLQVPEGRQLFVLAYCWKMQGGHSYLHLATHRGFQGVALAILNSSRGERLLHGRNHLGRTPLHVACANGEHYRNSRLVKAFIDAGAELDAVDHGGRTPLHWACMSGDEPAIIMLLAAGADLCARDKNNKMPIQHAEDVPGRREIVMDIIERCVAQKDLQEMVVRLITRPFVADVLQNFKRYDPVSKRDLGACHNHLVNNYPYYLYIHHRFPKAYQWDHND
mmetsp:Transcript_32579/g.85857  ORF Transcript_32579/g.85857 Transcript_32579/m.85857 type:complete len:675 (+) Transcript_32579:447-2471(+)